MSGMPGRNRGATCPRRGAGWTLGSLLLGALIACAHAPRAGADSVAIVASRDNTLFQDADGDTSNGSGPVFFAGNNNQSRTRRALLRFDLAAHLDAEVRVDSVSLRLQVSSAPNATPQLFTLHPMLGDWGEGTSYALGGSGAPAAPTDATWLHAFYPSTFWAGPGGDFLLPASSTQTVGGVGAYDWTSPGMLDDVRAWVSGAVENFGWMIRGGEGDPATVRRFESRESLVPADRPTLTVFYTRTTSVTDRRAPGAWLGASVPNPTPGAARMNLALLRAADVEVWIADVMGRRVASILRGPLIAGRHELSWSSRSDDGQRVPPGCYQWRVSVNQEVVGGRRLVVVR